MRALTLIIVALLAGCVSVPEPVSYARPYPAGRKANHVLDIQVFRSARHITFTNTTARTFDPAVIWLNARYSLPIETLGPGDTRRLTLSDFRDQHSEAFRGGGFFATRKPERLVLAEVETADGVFGLVVVGGEGE